jgi:osmotically-inducible protein OsmY
MRCIRTLIGSLAVVGQQATRCKTINLLSAGQWADDKATTARVKTALGATKLATLTRVDVDTVEGVVYLNGKVESDDVRRRAEEIAKQVTGTKHVANGLLVDHGLAQQPPRDATRAGGR